MVPSEYKPVYERLVTQDRPLSITLISRLLGVSRQSVYNMLKDGRLDGQRITNVLEYVRHESERPDYMW